MELGDFERRRLTRNYKALVDSVAAILFRMDPIGIAEGNPHRDEYASEAAAIARLMPQSADEDHLRRGVHKVFVHYFGEDTAGPEERYAEITREIRAASMALRNE